MGNWRNLFPVALIALGALRGTSAFAATVSGTEQKTPFLSAPDTRADHVVEMLSLAPENANVKLPQISAEIDWSTRTLSIVASGFPRIPAAELSHTMPHTLAEADAALRRRLREATLVLPLGWPLTAPLDATKERKVTAPSSGSAAKATYGPGPRASFAPRLSDLSLRPILLPSGVRKPAGQRTPCSESMAQRADHDGQIAVPKVGEALAQLQNQALFAAVDAAVGHYRAELTNFGVDGHIEIAASLPLDGANDALGPLWPRLRSFLPTALGTSRQGLRARATQRAVRIESRRATGLIIQAKGLGAKPCLWPRLYNAHGQLLYGPELIDDEVLVGRGVASFSRSLEHARRDERVGEKPVVARALSLLRPMASDLTIDTAQLPEGEVLSELFADARVLIVLD